MPPGREEAFLRQIFADSDVATRVESQRAHQRLVAFDEEAEGLTITLKALGDEFRFRWLAGVQVKRKFLHTHKWSEARLCDEECESRSFGVAIIHRLGAASKLNRIYAINSGLTLSPEERELTFPALETNTIRWLVQTRTKTSPSPEGEPSSAAARSLRSPFLLGAREKL